MNNIFNGYEINSDRDIERHRNDVYKKYPYVMEQPVKKDYVFDENQSVKWNREQVEKHNNDINTRKKYRQSMIYQELHQIQIATVQYIQSELSPHVSEGQAARLYEKLYREFESGLFQGKLDTLLTAILEVFS